MRPRPFFQSLLVFTCFDRGLRFFVSKLCPNSMDARLKLPPRSSSYIYRIAGGGLSGHARDRQQPGIDEFECAEQVTVDAPHALVGEHLVEGPPCAVAPVDVELEVFEAVGLVPDARLLRHGRARETRTGRTVPAKLPDRINKKRPRPTRQPW